MVKYSCMNERIDGQLPDEYLDLVNNKDEVIGKKRRSLIYQERLSNFRVINGFVINEKGQLWIPQRVHNKTVSPDALDFSVGGHVGSGEKYDDAFEREAREELKFDVSTINYRKLGKLSPEQDGVASFMQIYEIPMEQTPKYNPEDFIKSYWLYPHQLLTMIRNGKPAKSDLSIVLKRFYVK